MSFDVMLRQMTAGFGQTCLIFFMTLIFSLPLGMLVYFGRVSRIKPISWIVKIYISIMRGTPLMLQLLVWYFAPYYLWQMNIGGYKLTAILLGCSLNYAAYFAEIYRSGIESIPKGQYEAATLLGYSRGQTFFRIVLPLSGPILAVMVLFYGVAQWNSWFPALLYISDRGLYPLQMVLREVLIQSDISNMAGSSGDVEIIGDGLKYATMVVATLPIMCLYPFLQKYFVKGVMIGAVKG